METNAFAEEDDAPRLFLPRTLAVEALAPSTNPNHSPSDFVASYVRGGRTVGGYRKPARRR